MPHRGLLRSCLAITVGLAAACASSPPTRFYLLSSVDEAPIAGGAEARAPFVVVIGPVSLPDYLDRPQIVTRQGENSLEIASLHRWAGSLQDMIARVLAEDVAARLPRDRIVPFPSARGSELDYRVAVDIGRFDVDDRGEAVLVAGWRVYGRSGRAFVDAGEATARSQAASDGYDDRVAAMSRALGDLGAELARAVLQLEASGG
jgi:uncharacterized lipoprotein YmbA